MKTLILPFLFLLAFLVSCGQDEEVSVQKTNSYDVYVSGKENSHFCYWKNGTKHNITDIPAESAPSEIFVDANDVYVKGRYGYWKNGNYITYAQAAGTTSQDVIDIFDLFVKNGNVYFAGYTWQTNNPATDKFEFCYWKNGAKILLFKDSSTYNDNCSITEFNNDVYVGAQKNTSGIMNHGYFKNNVFYPVATGYQYITEVVSNETNVYFSSLFYYKNLISGLQTNFTPTPTSGSYKPALDQNDVYINGRFAMYYKNSVAIAFTSPFPIIQDMKVTDQNVYMIRNNFNNTEYKVFINDVETQSLQNVNSASSFNNIAVVKN